MLKIGSVVSREDGSELAVSEIGERCDMTGGYLAPIRLADDSYGIASVYDDQRIHLNGLWEPDTPEAAAALRQSVAMPRVQRGIGSDVVHVHGKDQLGEYFLKLYYNEKKDYEHRLDELYR